MQQRVSVNGSATIPTSAELHDRVLLVVDAEVADHGVKAQAQHGEIIYSKLRLIAAMEVTGADADEWRARVKEANDDADEQEINGE